MTAREYLENKYPQMRGDKWNTHDVINDNWVAEMMTEYAEAKAKEFAEWLHENRWFSFTNGKWNYSFEQGTSISDATYEKNYRKTTQELYEKFKTNH